MTTVADAWIFFTAVCADPTIQPWISLGLYLYSCMPGTRTQDNSSCALLNFTTGLIRPLRCQVLAAAMATPPPDAAGMMALLLL